MKSNDCNTSGVMYYTMRYVNEITPNTVFLNSGVIHNGGCIDEIVPHAVLLLSSSVIYIKIHL